MRKGSCYVLWILAAAILAAAGSWFISSATYDPAYRSEATLAVGCLKTGEELSSGLAANGALADALGELLNSSLMHRTILETLELDRFEGSILAERIPETNLLELRVTAADPETAFRVICAVMQRHSVVTEQVMGTVEVHVLQEPQLPDMPVDPLDLKGNACLAGMYAALLASVLCIWHVWSGNAVGMERPELDLPQFLGRILGQAWRLRMAGVGLVLVCSVGFCAYRYAVYQPVYELSASFTVRLDHGEDNGFPSRTADQLAKTMPGIMTGDVLLHRVAENLALEHEPEAHLAVSAGSGIMTLTVRDSEPDTAWEALSAILSCYPEVAEYVVGPTKLFLLEESGIPEEPVNPFSAGLQIRKGACIGFGLWIMGAIVLALYQLTIHSVTELSQLVPCDWIGENGETIEVSCRETALNKKILMVTSSLPGEGKSTAAWNLALTHTTQGRRVLLVECNPRNPSLTGKLGLRGKAGMSEYLNGQAQLRDIIRKTGIPNLYAMALGTEPGKWGMQTRSLKEQFRTASGKLFDCVILDGPPASALEYMVDMAELADGAILVVGKNLTYREQVKETEELLRQMGIPVVGAILNSRK